MHKLEPFRKVVQTVFCTVCFAMLSCTHILQPCVHAETDICSAPELGVQAYSISYTASEELTAQMESVFAGNVNLAADAALTPVTISLAVSSALDTRATYYAYNAAGNYTIGMQCYIYAQAVYATLFDDLPYHGAGTIGYSYSAQVMGQSPTVDYRVFSASKVMPGAYLRTTDQPDGTYNGEVGHSLIVLGYNEDGLTILEGNADSKGLIRIASYTWENFNESVLTRYGRVISHVVQPREDVYRDKYGLEFEALAADTGNDTPAQTEPVPSGDFTMHRQQGHMQLPELGDDFTWTSNDESIVAVDENGELVAVGNGVTEIIAENGTDSYSYTVTVSLVAWEKLGDINGDSLVNTMDAILLLQQYNASLMDDTIAADEQMQLYGDIDDDGQLDAADAVLVLRYYVSALTDAALDAETRWGAIL